MDTIKKLSLEDLKGASVYIDTNIFVYFLEKNEPFYSMVLPFFRLLLKREMVGFVGQAVVAEVLVSPYKIKNDFLVQEVKAFFAQKNFLTILEHDEKAFDLAAKISGTKSMKLVDSLHFATALQAHCQYLITHDKGMKVVDGITIARLDELL